MKELTFLKILLVVGSSITSVSSRSCYGSPGGHVSGNITLGFLFPFYGYDESLQRCSEDVPSLENIQLVEAVIMMVSRKAGNPKTVFGLESWDVCSSRRLAVDYTLAYLTNQLSSSVEDGDVCIPRLFRPGLIAGMEEQGQGEAVSRLVTEARVPLISYANSQSSVTKDSPYTFRTSPSDDFEAAGIVQLLQRMNWTYVTTINLNSSEDKAALESFQKAAKSAGICTTLPQEYSLDSSVEDVVHLINNINTSVSVVVIFVPSVGLSKLTAAIQLTPLGSNSDVQLVLSHRAVVNPPSNVTSLKGCLAFRIPSSQSDDEFDDYFRNLMPDTVDPTHNPWFRDYWQKKFHCNLDESVVFEENCTSAHVQLHKTLYKRHPYVSYVLDAVSAYMNAVHAVYNLACPQMNHSSPCHPVLTDTELVSQIQQIDVTKTDGGGIAFLPSGDFFYSSLEVVNYKMVNHSYRFLPVGTFNGGKLNVDPVDLELWSEQGMSPVSSVCEAPCKDPACGEPTSSMNETAVYLKGDVILGGLFSVHDWNTGRCGDLDESGFKRLEAMMYALDKINNDSTILPGLTLGMDGFDTCASPELAGHQVLQMVSNAQFGQSGSGQRPNSQGLSEHIYGIVGPNDDEECQLVNGILNTYGMPIVSYGATSTSLSNTAVNKNFARTVFTGNMAGFAILQAISDRGWQYVQLLRSNTQSARVFLSVLQQSGGRMDVCVTNAQVIPSVDDTEGMQNVFDILTSRPEAKVIVVFATSSDMRLILEQFQNRHLFGQYYLVLIAEWMSDPSLQQDFTEIAPGITFMSEGKRSYPDFRRYFSNLSPANNKRNPWMSEYWAKKFQCNLPGITFQYSNYCTGMESLSADDSTDRRISQTVDAVYAIARAVSALHERYCPGQSRHVCPEMVSASGNELFQLLTSRDNYFASITDGYMVEINTYGDVKPNYEVFNIQLTPNGTLVNTQIGIYQNYQYQGNENSIVAYAKNGSNFEEILQPISICNGTCDDCQRKKKVLVAEIPNGDVWLGGLFELHEMNTDELTCKEDLQLYNIQLVEAFLFAVDNINSNPALLPDLQLGAIAFDTCGNADRAHNEVFNFVSGKVDYRNGYLQINPSVVGIIGGSTSNTSLTTGDVLTPFGINQISYAATTSELSDSSRFPYFLRTVPSDEKQASAIVDILVALEWQYISIVYSNDPYGNDLLQQVTPRLAATSICVAMRLKVVATDERIDYDEVAKQLNTNALARVVLLLTSHMGTREVLEAAERISIRHLQWIGTETWGDRHDVIQNAAITSRGALIVQFQNHPSVQAFREYFTGLKLYTNRRNPWWTTFWEDTFQCNTYGSSRYSDPCSWLLDLGSDYMQETGVSYILDAVHIFAIGLHNAMTEICPNTTRYICNDLASQPDILHRHMLEVSLTRSDGSSFKLDENGDGQPYFDLLTVQHNANQTNSYAKVGSWLSGRLNLTSFRPSVTSQCVGRCSECYASYEQDSYVHIPGPLQMLGLFAAHATGNHLVECGGLREAGVVYLEAMLFAIDSINANPFILSGVSLGASVFDTCARSSRGLRALSSAFNGQLAQNESPTQQSWSLIAGVIGSENTEVTLDTAALANQYKYVQISYGAGLSNVDLGNFLQMGPSVSSQIQAIRQLLLYFSWHFVGIVTSRSAYRLHQGDAFIEEATSHQICIGTREEMTADTSTLLQRLYETTDQNVVVLFLDEGDIPHFVKAVEMQKSKHITWVVAFNQEIMDNFSNDKNLLGAFFINSIQPQIPELKKYISSLNATSNQRNPWFGEFMDHLNSCDRDSGECSGTIATIVEEHEAVVNNIINSVYAIAHGVQDLLDQHCEGIPGLCADFVGLGPDILQQAVHNTTFTGLDGEEVKFHHGSSKQQFSISTIKATNDSSQIQKVGSWIGGDISMQISQVSFYNLQGEPSRSPVSSQCLTSADCSVICPLTEPATTKAPSSHVPVTSIVQPTTPPLTMVTTSSANNRSKLLSVSNLQSAWFVVLIVIAVIGSLASLCLIVMFIRRWKSAITQVMSPFLCTVLLAGNILVYLLIPVLAAPPHELSCALLRVWPGVAFSVCHVAVLLMSVRLYRKARAIHPVSAGKLNLLSTWSQLALFVVLMAVEIVIVVEWLILQPPEVVAGGASPTSGDNGGVMAVCAYTGSSLGPLSYVYVLLACAGMTMVMAGKRKDMISRMELATLSAIVVGSVILLIGWHLLEHLASVSYQRPGMSIIAAIQATMILLLTSRRAKALTSSNDPVSASGQYIHREDDIDLSIDHFPTSGDPDDDENPTGSQINLTDAMQE